MSKSIFAGEFAGKPILFALAALSLIALASAQNTSNSVESDVSANPQANAAPLTVTLQDAIARARKNNPEYRAALTEYGLAKEDRVQGRAALLPGVNYNAGFLYTQGNGTSTGRFIATNGVHEYSARVMFTRIFRCKGSPTTAARAQPRRWRGHAPRSPLAGWSSPWCRPIIISSWRQRKFANAQRAATEGQHFLDISQKLENGGEVAHSDVIKAQIQSQQQQRDLQEAELEMNRSRLELAVLVFPDFNQNFSVVDDLQTPEPLPSLPEVQAAAAHQNPELRAAMAALQEARQEVGAAWSGFLPSLKLDYFYGIDANHFATSAVRSGFTAARAQSGLRGHCHSTIAGMELGRESQPAQAGRSAAGAGAEWS